MSEIAQNPLEATDTQAALAYAADRRKNVRVFVRSQWRVLHPPVRPDWRKRKIHCHVQSYGGTFWPNLVWGSWIVVMGTAVFGH
jgi:hypothetical protein